MYEYDYKLIDNFTGTIKSETSLGRPQVINLIEREYGKGTVKSVNGSDVQDSIDESEQTHTSRLTVEEIQESWARAFAKVPQS